MNSLKNKKVVIIGGSKGIGFETAKMAYNKGAKIVIASRSLDNLKNAKAAIGEGVQIYQLDGSNEKQVCIFFSQVDDIDHLIIAAAGAVEENSMEMDMKVAKGLFDSKLWLLKYIAKYGAPKIVRGGSVILFSNTIGSKTEKGQITYTEIADSIESLGKSLALGSTPIRVNVITTGLIQAETLSLKKSEKTEHVVKVVSFLMNNDFVTGSVIDIEGGQKLI